MRTRKESLFSAKKKSSDSSVISARVKFKLNKKKGVIDELKPHEKMLCALRKVLADISSSGDHCSYFIANDEVYITKAPTSTEGKPGEARSYHARGRFRAGVCLPGGESTTKVMAFEISYKDVVDEIGLADVVYFDPTTIDELPKNTQLNGSAKS